VSVVREYPAAPLVGVAGVVVRGGDVLLIQRGREPMVGAWSLPGGLLELGETTAEGVVREVFEETGLRVRPVEIVATVDRIIPDEAGRVRFHYVLVEWLCVSEMHSGEDPVCGDDATAAIWLGRDEIYSETYDLGEPTLSVIEKALKLAGSIER
jgi:8-oxo-dGTP diphosphatase